MMIEVQNLVKKFNSKVVLNKISFEVEKGEVFGYLGPNGAGKTTTMRIILGLLKPTAGKALVWGQDLGENTDLRKRIGVLLENDGLYDRLNAYDNLDYYARLYRVTERERRIKELLEFVGLYDRKKDKVGKFSKGMKRKLALARAIIHDPELLFLDEPSSGLDPEAQKMVRDLILQLSKEKRTIFLNSHDLDEVQRICSKIAILQNGEIKVHDSIENLRRKFSNSRVEIVFGDTIEAKRALDFIASLDYILERELQNARIVVTLKDKSSSELLRFLTEKGIRVEEIRKVTKSLEEIYFEVLEVKK